MARATVTLTIEMDAPGSWGNACDLGQVEKQATEGVIHALKRACSQSSLHIKIVGTPKVTAIIVPTGA